MTSQKRKNKLQALVNEYTSFKEAGKLDLTSEETIRTWLNAMLKIFGWDVRDTSQILQEKVLSKAEKERLQKIDSTSIRPDYTFKVAKQKLTFLDAKDLRVDLKTDSEAHRMNKTFEKIINKYIENEHLVNRMIVTVFVEANGFKVSKNELIKNLLIPHSDRHYLEISSLFDTFSFEQLIEAFEVAIPSGDKQTNGAVYTPKIIKDFITSRSLKALSEPFDQILCADISCGCGAFLYSLAVAIHEATGNLIENIIKNQLFGLDISHSSILRAKILLSLLALSKGEDKKELEFNLYTANALDFVWQAIPKVQANNGFDLIVGNPPYVRAKHIDEISKLLLKKWQVTKSGNPDLYIPFFEIGFKNLNPKGVLGYITVNTFYRSVNARSLRTYFEAHQVNLKIIDFGHEQVFANKLAYTCICFLSKEKSAQIYFTKATLKSLPGLHKGDFTPIPYRSLNSHRGWLLNNPKAIYNIKKIESCGTPLGKLYTIKNGIATLSNDTYIFKPADEDDRYYFFEKFGKKYKVEKSICRDIIKPNILKYEHEIPKVREKLIYPYTNGITPLTLIKEDYFKDIYPMAYQSYGNKKNGWNKGIKEMVITGHGMLLGELRH